MDKSFYSQGRMRWAILLLAGILLTFPSVQSESFADSGFADTPIPKEPGWKDPGYRGWELLSITGLIATYYDLDLDGKLDYQVVRKIIRKTASEELSIKEAVKLAQFDGMAIYVSYPVIYFTNKNPLFYCLGVDFRKNCENIWIDVAEDGLNGNETKYTLSRKNPMVR